MKRKHLLCIIILISCITGFYYHAFVGDNLQYITTHIPGDLMDPLYVVCLYQWHYQQINNGFNGFWTCPWYYPYERTLTYSEHCFFLGVLAYPAIMATNNPVLANNIIHYLGYLFTALALYYSCFVFTRSFIAGIICGLFALFPQQVQSYRVHLYAFPMVFTFIYLFMKTERLKYLFLTALFFMIGFLTSNHVGAYLVIFTPIWGFCFFIHYKRYRNKKLIAWCMLVAVVMFCVLLPFIIPYIQTSAEMGFKKHPENLKFYRPDITSYISPNIGAIFYKRLLNKYVSNDAWITLYKARFKLFPGFALFILAAIGFAKKYKNVLYPQRVLLVTCMLAFIFSFGAYFYIYGKWIPNYIYLVPYYCIPGMGRIRITVRVMMVFYVSLSLLAGFGIQKLLTKEV